MAEHKVEALVRERQRFGVADFGCDVKAELVGVALQRLDHSWRDVCADRLIDRSRHQQVKREVTGAGANLKRAAEMGERAAERLLNLRQNLVAANHSPVNPPLGVVV